jgi:hypothetical protein
MAAGLLVVACSDNSGPAGPSFQNGQTVPVTGTAPTAKDIKVQVVANPASTEPGRRVGITVFVTNTNGQPLAGKKVVVNTSTNTKALGTVDAALGTTDANGIYQTTVVVRCNDAVDNAGSPLVTLTVDAFVEGASSATTGGSATVTLVSQSGNPPCPPVVLPAAP